MASVPVDVSSADRLRAQAAALEARAEDLSREARGLRVEADDLREEADAIAAGDNRTPLEDVREFVDALGPVTVTDTANSLGVTPSRAREALERLRADGVVTRSGVSSGTTYRMATDGQRSTDELPWKSYEGLVRDAIARLDTFTIRDLRGELPDVGDGTLRRWLKHWEGRGVVEAEGYGRGRVYAYVSPRNGSSPARPRGETPEARVLREAGPIVARARGPIAGTGQTMRAGGKLVNELLREVRGFPRVKVEKRTHKYAFLIDGREVANCSSTPGAATSLAGTRRKLRDAGVMVKS